MRSEAEVREAWSNTHLPVYRIRSQLGINNDELPFNDFLRIIGLPVGKEGLIKYRSQIRATRAKERYQSKYPERRTEKLQNNSKCEICASSEHLQIHHIHAGHKDHSKENLMTLCQRCHAKITSHWGKGKDWATDKILDEKCQVKRRYVSVLRARGYPNAKCQICSRTKSGWTICHIETGEYNPTKDRPAQIMPHPAIQSPEWLLKEEAKRV